MKPITERRDDRKPFAWKEMFGTTLRRSYNSGLRLFFQRHLPDARRILLVESGSRELIERIIPSLRGIYGERLEVDVVTCYDGQTPGVNGQVFNVNDYGGGAGRDRLWADLGVRGPYPVVGILCSAEPIMTKWKWWLGAKLPSKILIINENADCFWLDWAHLGIVRQFVAYRAGLTGPAAVPSLIRLAAFPVTFTYLLLYACTVHLRRKIRLL